MFKIFKSIGQSHADPNDILINGVQYATVMNPEAIPFIVSTKGFFIGEPGDIHFDICSSHGLKETDLILEGRIWPSDQIISIYLYWTNMDIVKRYVKAIIFEFKKYNMDIKNFDFYYIFRNEKKENYICVLPFQEISSTQFKKGFIPIEPPKPIDNRKLTDAEYHFYRYPYTDESKIYLTQNDIKQIFKECLNILL